MSMRFWTECVIPNESLKHTNIPGDPGRETFAGISRRYQPNWTGWAHVDAGHDEIALALAYQWYKARWKHLRCDQFTHEGLALKLFDQAVLWGAKKAGLWLQESINAWSTQPRANGVRAPLIVEDGIVGTNTVIAANELLKSEAKAAQVLMGQSAAVLHLVNDTGDRRVFLAGHLIRAGRIYL